MANREIERLTTQSIALKSNCARGFAQAEAWQAIYTQTIAQTLKAWRRIPDLADVEPLAWEAATTFTHYKSCMSDLLGVYSTIRDMVIPAQTYTNKKGITKTIPEQRIPSHYSESGDFIGRVSTLGPEPRPYPIRISITTKTCKFVKVGFSVADCFEVLSCEEYEAMEGDEPKVKSATKEELKAFTSESSSSSDDTE